MTYDPRSQALHAASKYLQDIEELSTHQLIDQIEQCAYNLARDGNGIAAKTLFIAVAGLELMEANQ